MSEYKTAFYVEGLGTSPFFSVGIEHCPQRSLKNFSVVRAGLGFLFSGGEGALSNTKLALPISVSHSFIINNLKKRVKHRVSLRCNPNPPRFSTEWFGEYGLGYTPQYFGGTSFRHNVYGIIAFRQQIVINKPPRPKVYYLKIQYNPYFSSFEKKFFFLPEINATIFGASLAFSIR
ncbi:MAG: hypothetical protein ACRCVT_08620 [Leadbetterella sp.]